MTKGRRGLGPLVLLLAAIGVLILLGLGVWQVQRLAWKNDLIARVDARVAADPVAPPPPAQWDAMTADQTEYLRVAVQGRFLPDDDTLVQAVTTAGSGFWVMTPFQAIDGWIVLVNRGFVPRDQRAESDRPLSTDLMTVTGLLRETQPKGAFLRTNDPTQDRWYSRDVQEIAAARNLGPVAPWFIDADDGANGSPPDALPIGGLTVIHFPNSHLSYALTWFGMAVLLVIGVWFADRRARDRGRIDP